MRLDIYAYPKPGLRSSQIPKLAQPSAASPRGLVEIFKNCLFAVEGALTTFLHVTANNKNVLQWRVITVSGNVSSCLVFNIVLS